jgi:hypothetical protein
MNNYNYTYVYPTYEPPSDIQIPPPNNTNITKENRLAKFDSIIRKHEINPCNAIRLRQLEGFEIVIICDDSGSMSNPVSNPSITNHNNLPSRWDELKSVVSSVIEIAGVLDKTGVDIYFLNRPGIKNVTDVSQIEPYFATELKYFCGHYLKEQYGNKYCIILTQAYSGINRFNSFYQGDGCEKRTWFLKYFYKPFAYQPNKKYVNKDKYFQFFDNFHEPLIEFSNSYYKNNIFGCSDIVYSSKFDFIIFWNRVNELEPYCEY